MSMKEKMVLSNIYSLGGRKYWNKLIKFCYIQIYIQKVWLNNISFFLHFFFNLHLKMVMNNDNVLCDSATSIIIVLVAAYQQKKLQSEGINILLVLIRRLDRLLFVCYYICYVLLYHMTYYIFILHALHYLGILEFLCDYIYNLYHVIRKIPRI